MQIGLVGLGRMGGGMALRLARGGHEVAVYDSRPEAARSLAGQGAVAAGSLRDLVKRLKPPRTVWLMVPAGAAVDSLILALARLLSRGDLVADGGNSLFHDAHRRAATLSVAGVRFMDIGVSGGVRGLEDGYCLMAGGDKRDFERLEPALRTLAPEGGYLLCGGIGAGHFVKMVHNGIEYGMMQACAEGFEILQASPYPQDLAALCRLWNRGSVIRSWLLELAGRAFAKDPGLERVSGYVEDTGEGRWTVKQAVDSGVPAPAITAALFQRYMSRDKDAFSLKVLAALRNQFGGHPVRPPARTRRPVAA